MTWSPDVIKALAVFDAENARLTPGTFVRERRLMAMEATLAAVTVPAAIAAPALAEEPKADWQRGKLVKDMPESEKPHHGPIPPAPSSEAGTTPNSDIAVSIGAEVRRRNRAGDVGEQGSIAPCFELAATELVLKALASCGYTVAAAPPIPSPSGASTENRDQKTGGAAQATPEGVP